jgi:hypothetical protein
MNLESEILKEHSKPQVKRIARWIGRDKNRFRQLMNLFIDGDYRVTQRSAWILSHCAESDAELIYLWLKPIIKKMQEPGVHNAVKRNTLRILQNIEIPTPLLGIIVSLCFDYLNSLEAPIAVKAYSMTVLLNIARREPDLKHELQLVLEQMLPYVGAALRARSRIILKELAKK